MRAHTHQPKRTGGAIELPFGKGKPWIRSGIGSAILGGWRTSGVYTFASGRPFTVVSGSSCSTAIDYYGAATAVPNVIGTPEIVGNVNCWFYASNNKACAAIARKIGVIDDPQSLDAVPLKRKAASLHWEFMFARSMWQTADMVEQARLLNRVSELVDRGELRSTQTQTFSPISVENLKKAHAIAESGKAIGKVTLSEF